MKKRFMYLMTMMMVAMLSIGFASCGGDDDEDINNITQYRNYEMYSNLYDQLFDTTWALKSITGPSVPDNKKSNIGQTLTFSSERVNGVWKLYSSCFTGYGGWLLDDDGKLFFNPAFGMTSLTAFESGSFVACMGNGGDIITLNSNTLIFRRSYDDGYYYDYTYVAYTGGSSGGSSDTGNNSYEKPEIGLMDYTCYKTSITVRYRIYNQDKAKVTSAKGYYGVSSASTPVNATVAGSLITINVSGLKAGTKYYIKCSATGQGGTTTSETTSFMTNS